MCNSYCSENRNQRDGKGASKHRMVTPNGKTGDALCGTNIIKTNDPEGYLTQLTETIKKVFENDIHISTVITYTGKQEWHNEECDRALNKKLRIWRKCKANNREPGLTDSVSILETI